ncbi:MAG: Lipoprotein signal peptidase [Firmicutes bacterium ADurb.Bin182]|nr:MAG: Lipoprotein signal peptidase [Firmicutes bacterium ADurb.Bin182]
MLELLIIAVIIVLDLITKNLAANLLRPLPGRTFPFIEGIFHFTYVENKGAAFGMLWNARWLFISVTFIVCGLCIYALIRYRSKMHLLLRISIALIVAGALGNNLFDRIFLGYVRDMFEFRLINFAVFNVADSAVTIGAVILVLDVLFGKGKKLLDELDSKKK